MSSQSCIQVEKLGSKEIFTCWKTLLVAKEHMLAVFSHLGVVDTPTRHVWWSRLFIGVGVQTLLSSYKPYGHWKAQVALIQKDSSWGWKAVTYTFYSEGHYFAVPLPSNGVVQSAKLRILNCRLRQIKDGHMQRWLILTCNLWLTTCACCHNRNGYVWLWDEQVHHIIQLLSEEQFVLHRYVWMWRKHRNLWEYIKWRTVRE